MHRMDHPIKVLIINPYHTGSHAKWSDDLTNNLNTFDEFEVLQWSMPGKHWKWRMQGAAIECARLASKSAWTPDVILTSDMLNCAAFRGMIPVGWRNIPLAQYFHENQITYPWSPGDPDPALQRDRTYGMINVLSALAADYLWFNSEHHLQVFFDALPSFIQPLPDFNELFPVTSLMEKSAVLPILITPSSENEFKLIERKLNAPPVLLWNHRWDHDKGPDRFYNLLQNLEAHGHDFQLILTGPQSPASQPELLQIKRAFGHKIIHMGYAESKEAYRSLLRRSDFIIHDPRQEYFGISVLEAMSEGVIPILRRGHAYDAWIHPDLSFEHLEESIQIFQKFSDLEKWRSWSIATSKRFSQKVIMEHYAEYLIRIHVENLAQRSI